MPSLAIAVATRLRRLVNRAGFDVVRDDMSYRFVPALEQHGIDAVLDVGANVGQFAAELRRAGFSGLIVSVEPLRDAFRALARRAATDPQWRVERAAISDRAGTVTLNVAANSVSSSVLPMRGEHLAAAPAAHYVGTEAVASTTVDDVIARHGLDPERTVLKIDVQGYERSVLDGATESLPRLAAVRTEMSLVPLYEGQVLLPEMISFLAEREFELWLVERGFTDPRTRRLLQVDGVFFRRTSATPVAALHAGRGWRSSDGVGQR